MVATNAVTQLSWADHAARAAALLLPSATRLTVGTATQQADMVPLDGQAVYARFTGSVHGQIAIILGPELIEEFAADPVGSSVDLTQGARPALEAAAVTLGPVVLEPGELLTALEALAAIVAAGGLLVPLTRDAAPVAVVALAVTAPPAAAAAPDPVTPHHSELLHDVELDVIAELGRTRMNVRELLALAPGVLVELDRAASAPISLLVNGRPIARGEVVVIDENYGLRITEVLTVARS